MKPQEQWVIVGPHGGAIPGSNAPSEEWAWIKLLDGAIPVEGKVLELKSEGYRALRVRLVPAGEGE